MTSPKVRAPAVDWDEARRLLLQAISEAVNPVAAATLGSLKGLGRKTPSTQLLSLLEGDIDSGTVFLWGSRTKPSFWTKSPENIARERLLEISAVEMLTKAGLEKRAAPGPPKLSAAVVKRVQRDLLAEGGLSEIPAAAGSKGRRVLNVKRPEVYLEAEISGLLERFGLHRPAERIQALLAGVETHEAAASAGKSADKDVREVAGMIFEAMSRLAFAPGTTVTFFRLRQQPELANIPKRIFDEAALLLQAERRALLSIHDHAQALPKEEQDRFVTDGLGHFYVSIYAR